MTHEEFVRAYKSGQITVAVNRHLVLSLMNSPYVAGRYKATHLFWTWVWFLAIPAGIATVILVKWWIGLIVLALGFFLPRAIKNSATGFVLKQALEDEQFYHFATKEGLLKISGVSAEIPEIIVREYGEILEQVSQEGMEKYPCAQYPQSLLPWPKETIQQALQDSLRDTDDEGVRENLKIGLVMLDDFIEDEEANRKNSEMLRIMKQDFPD